MRSWVFFSGKLDGVVFDEENTTVELTVIISVYIITKVILAF